MIPLLTVPAFFFPAVAIEFISRRTQAQTNAVAMSSRVYSILFHSKGEKDHSKYQRCETNDKGLFNGGL